MQHTKKVRKMLKLSKKTTEDAAICADRVANQTRLCDYQHIYSGAAESVRYYSWAELVKRSIQVQGV